MHGFANRNALHFAFPGNIVTFMERREKALRRLENHRKEELVIDETGTLASMERDMAAFQVESRAQRSMLQALHLTQNEHTAALRELRAGQRSLEQGLAEVREGLVEVRAGIKTIVGLLETVTVTGTGS